MDISFVNTFIHIFQSTELDSVKNRKLIRLFQLILDKALEDEFIHFTSLFSKIAYLGDKFELSGQFLYELHHLRNRLEGKLIVQDEANIQLLSYIIPRLLSQVLAIDIPHENLADIPHSSGLKSFSKEINDFIATSRFLCLEMDKQRFILYGILDESPLEKIQVIYNQSHRNERFTDHLQDIDESMLPILMQLNDVEIDHEGLYSPKSIVIEPDYLFDVSTIAACFTHQGTESIEYVLRKFLPHQWSKALLLGNVSNFFLDKLIENPHVRFEDLLLDIFQLDPLSFAFMQDADVPGFVLDMKKHFFNIQRTVTQEFTKEGISLDTSYLEPSFISARFGLQGRLDLLNNEGQNTTIVELKSGSIYRPNVYGLKNDHYTQTLLYDLLVRSVFEGSRPKSYILYSKEKKDNLRLAPRIAAQQNEGLRVRNELLSIEHSLSNEEALNTFFMQINPQRYEHLKGFSAKNVEQFNAVFNHLDLLEKSYFNAYTAFIAKEHRLSKIGEYGQDKSNGLAGLWLDSFEEKCEQFNMLFKLKISNNRANRTDAEIDLIYSSETNRLSNFRKGDIAVFYPYHGGQNSVLKNQLFKCSIVEMGSGHLTIRLRSQQKNLSIFKDHEFWCLEHDMMDTSFHMMYRQLFEWAAAPKNKRDLLLGLKEPSHNVLQERTLHSDGEHELIPSQKLILDNIIDSSDYYLVWGPPGTGKTSKVLKHYIQYILDHTEENLYVIAYTNRAVDEICAAVEELGENYKQKYIRIGSRFSTSSEYKSQLLNEKIKGIKKRKKLIEVIKAHRMVVGTLASICGKEIIFSLIPPMRLVVDEASQILEPQIIGLLTRFKHFVMIGDHRQLPAVVVQEGRKSTVENADLHAIGLRDRRDSLFERLYRLALEKKWNHAVGLLHYQGRMHPQIMEFASKEFYNNQLIPMRFLQGQTKEFQHMNRVEFYHIPLTLEDRFSKTNVQEANKIVALVKFYTSLGFQPENIGIISPFRAQIAAISDKLADENEAYEAIQVDTVERFQGGAKDVILISFCCNSIHQLKTIVSLSNEGVDRKLNVAITRARKFLVMIGDKNILGTNALYRKLIDQHLVE